MNFRFILFLSLSVLFPAFANPDIPLPFLDSSKAKLLGKEIANNKGTITNWKEVGSGLEWKFKTESPGKYYLFFQMVAPETDDGLAEVFLDDRSVLVWNVPSTKDDKDFQVVCAGSLELDSGEHTLKVTAKELKRDKLMDVKNAILSNENNPEILKSYPEKEKKRVLEKLGEVEPFTDAVLFANDYIQKTTVENNKGAIHDFFRKHFPHQSTWVEQDIEGGISSFLNKKLTLEELRMEAQAVLKALPQDHPLMKRIEELKSNGEAGVKEWLAFYEDAAFTRRRARLELLKKKSPQVIFAKHHVFGRSSGIYPITETEGTNNPSAMCMLDLLEEEGKQFAREKVFIDPGEGSVRDPELSFDGKKLLFAMRPTRKHFSGCPIYRKYAVYVPAPNKGNYLALALGQPESNYQIYELDMETKALRKLTSEETYGSSFEPCYLPNGDIMFSSARIVQHITCGWGDHSNLFIMNKDGKYARRVGFDQTNTAFPSLLNDGRVIYTRRDYNDRGQTSAHALFQMNSDGSNQTEYYGNQTGLPNSFQHTRAIPGSDKVITIIGGYHTTQGGKLAIMDIKKGREKSEGILEIPGYKKPKDGDGIDDRYGKQGKQYSNPYPLDERNYLISIAPNNNSHYSLYFMNDLGELELLASDASTSCLQAIPYAARPNPPKRSSSIDYTKDDGVFYVQNVYYGEAAKGIKPGSVKKMRVIEILYKNSTIGSAVGSGPGGGVDTVLPSGHGLATFDSKSIIGDATVYEDGSAMFYAPARKPLYFQLLDENNRVVQTMRSWTTLMPAERFSCVGCHENKNETPLNFPNKTIASNREIEKLTPFYGPTRAFSFIYEVQPVFDKHCISCHKQEGEAKHLLLTAEPYLDDYRAMRRFYTSYHQLTRARPENGHQPEEFAFWYDDPVWGPGRVKGKRLPDEPNKYVSWYTRFELMKPYPPYRAGSIRSGLVKTLEKGHKNVKLTEEELDKIRAWIDLNIPFAGEYDESNLWSDTEKAFYRTRVNERKRNEAIEARNIREFIKDNCK